MRSYWFDNFGEYAGACVQILTSDVNLPNVANEIDLFLQTSYDSGTTAVDLWNIALLNANDNDVIKKLVCFGRGATSATSVVDITDMRKNETKTEVISSSIIDVTNLDKAELDKVFQLPECEAMDDDEVQEKAKALFSAGKIML